MNIKDAYIHNGEAILKDIQLSGSKLQKLKAGKNADDTYLTWVDVLDLSPFGASGHNHDDRYLKLSGGTLDGGITFKYGSNKTDQFIQFSSTDSSDPQTVYLGIRRPVSSYGLCYKDNNGNLYDIIHSGNYTTYTVKKDGTGASGVWRIGITGNAATATNASSAGDADKLDGYHASYASNKPWGTIPVITNSGYMDVGRHFEFHYDNTTGSDYSTVLKCTGNYSNIVDLPSASGTLALLTDNVASATKLQNSRTIWGQSFDGTGKVSGSLTEVTDITASGNVSCSNLILPLGGKIHNDGNFGLYISGSAGDYGSAIYLTHDHGKNQTAFRIHSHYDSNLGGLTIGFSTTTQNYGASPIDATYADILHIRGNGNIGIGTTSPSYKLHVVGDIYTTTGFKKEGSSDSYVLLGGGGHKLLSDFSMAHSHPYLPLSGGTLTGSVTMRGMDTNLVRDIVCDYTSGWARNLITLRVDGVDKFSIGAYGNYTAGASDNGIYYGYIGCNDYDGLNLRISATSLSWGTNPILHAGNYNSYSPTLTGTGASGTWSISITGNAKTATTSTYASNVGSSGTAGTNYVTAANVISMYNWYNSITATDDASNTAIDKWNEIVSFLSGITDTSTLSGILAGYAAAGHDHDGRYVKWGGSAADTNAMAWGTLTAANGYTILSHAASSDGGDWGMANQSGKIYMQLDGYYYQNEGQYRVTDVSETVTALGTNGNYLTWTKNGSTNNITVPYASNAGSATNANYFLGCTNTITVAGDANTYYPVMVSTTTNKKSPNIITIWKDLGSKTASYPENHSNGTSSMLYRYDVRNCYWDGNGGYCTTLDARYIYARLVSETRMLSNGVGNFCIWLRGGGTEYIISTSWNISSSDITVYYSSTNVGSSTYPVTIAPRTDIGNGGVYNTISIPCEVKYASYAGSVAWNNVTGKPTTINGYGITDALKIDGSNGTADGVSTLINKLSIGSSDPTDADYYICQYAGGETTTTTYHRRPMSAMWNWIKAKTNTLYPTKTGSGASGTWNINITGSAGSVERATFGDGSNGTHDANAMTSNGLYYYISNGPTTNAHNFETNDGSMYVQAYNTSWVSQIAQDYRSGKLAVRSRNYGTWQPWRRIAFADSDYVISADRMYYEPEHRKFTRTASGYSWDTQAYSVCGYKECRVTYKISQTSAYIMVGLNSDPTTDASYQSIDYCWYTENGGSLCIYENGIYVSSISGHTTYAVGDEFIVEYSCGQVRYYHNGVLCRTVARTYGSPLYFDCSLYNAGSIENVIFEPIHDSLDFVQTTASYSLSNAAWTNTITLPTTAGSYILNIVSGNSTLTGVFSIGASDNAKDEISLHLHGNGPRLYARTNGTTLQLSSNDASATSRSVTIKYRRMI